MHEVSLCESIRDLLQEQANAQGFTRVTRVWLDIGALSCVEPDALRFCFDAVMAGSPAEGATLDIATVPAQAWCLTCNETVPVSARFAPCPVCGGDVIEERGGDDLKIRKVEVV